MVKVSVILPIYNVAPYLDETFQSILCQTLTDIEIIAVNDGSTDDSEEIIRKYQQQDARIISVTQNNQGLSCARNTALRHVTGEYIYMMDSDDILSSPNALQACYEYAEKNQADFIFFDAERFTDHDYKHISDIQRTHLVDENKKYDGEFLLNLMLDTKLHNSVVWLLLINTNFLKKLHLTFYPGILHEDELFTTILTLSSSSVFALKESYVKHRIRSTSIMGKKYSDRNMNCYLTVADELLKFRQTPIVHKFLRYTLSAVFTTGRKIPFKQKSAVFWRAMRSGYLKYIRWKPAITFWL